MVNFPKEEMLCTIMINDTSATNQQIQDQYNIMPDSVKVDLFDKTTWRPNTRLPNDEMINYNGENLWLNWWHMCSEQPFTLVVKPEHLENHFHFKYRLYKAGSQFENIHFVLVTSSAADISEELQSLHFDQTIYSDEV